MLVRQVNDGRSEVENDRIQGAVTENGAPARPSNSYTWRSGL